MATPFRVSRGLQAAAPRPCVLVVGEVARGRQQLTRSVRPETTIYLEGDR
jgi:hypothetical protein